MEVEKVEKDEKESSAPGIIEFADSPAAVVPPPRVMVRGVPRFRAPIATDKIIREAAPTNMVDLLEGVATAAGVAATATATTTAPDMGTGVRVEAAGVRAPPIGTRPARRTGTGFDEYSDVVEEAGVTRRVGPSAAAAVPGTVPVGAVGAVGALPATLAKLEEHLLAVERRKKVQVSPDAYIPSNRRAFKSFIIEAYRSYQLPKIPDIPDPDACKKAAEISKTEVKTFKYQSFVRDYMQRASPYRGVLVYHGLGSGKTCTSIASMEALYQADPTKQVFVLTPASLSPNYRDEITKCGPFVFRTNNHWRWIPIPNTKVRTAESELLLNTLGIPIYSLRKRKGGWLPDPTKAPNYDALSMEERKQVQEQIYEHIDARIQFIHYNGITEKVARDWACNTPRMFDGATLIIDEIHNLIRTINNSFLESFYKDEPRDLAQYMPVFCAVGEKYRISYLLYRMLCSAVGCKLIALSATPIINFPQEIAILANLLAGDTRMAEVNISGLGNQKKILSVAQNHPEIDFAEVLPRPEEGITTIRITPVPSGCRKVLTSDGTFRGFIRDERLVGSESEIARERSLDEWFGRIKAGFTGAGLPPLGVPKFRSVSRLPDIEKTFRDMFIDTEKLEVKERLKLPLMARLSGLISYYKGGKADLMAQAFDEEVYVDMSNLQLKKYTEQRKAEIDKEMKKKKEPAKDADKPRGGIRYEDLTKNVNSTFKIFSRASCNFVFPGEMERPTPSDYREVRDMIGAKEPPRTSEKAAGGAGAAVEEAEEEAEGEDVEEILTTEAVPIEAAPAAAPVAPVAPSSYDAAIAAAVSTLRTNSAEFFVKGKLEIISPKFQAILDRLLHSKGPALVYSNFKTLEGVGLFGVALEAQLGYKKFDIVLSGGKWELAAETRSAGPGTPRYITYTGDEDRQKRKILLDIFNGKWNKVPGTLAAAVKALCGAENNHRGDIVKVFMITQSGAEGISLSNVRQVHIMEPYWNYVRLDQVKGRAIRICSHMDLDPAERTVNVYTYIAKFSAKQLAERSVNETLLNIDGGKTTDQSIYDLLKAKKKLADSLLDVMKKSAVDCELNATENGIFSCYRFAGTPSMEPMFHPLVDVHIANAEAAVRAAFG